VPLAPCTTLQLGGRARHLIEVKQDSELIDALHWARAQALPVAILGGGSNVVVSDAGLQGLVIVMAQRGIELAPQTGDRTLLRAAAGEPWDEVVAVSVERGLWGLECLSGIPGRTGATPIQNVGAYGQEVANTIESVSVLDRDCLRVEQLSPAACGFGYRDSAFKRQPDRYVVLDVSFALRSSASGPPAYAELRAALQARASTPSPQQVRDTVLALRRKKSMLLDPEDENRRSAGSFFMNPVVQAGEVQRIVEQAMAAGWNGAARDVPRYPQADGRIKLAAGWLVERAGVHKGERRGGIGVSSRHALALVHHGGAQSADLLAFAREIRDRVHARFGVELVPEPVFLGFDPTFRF
jgi:UDP-N-acetylmuramate dehydrogenase